MASSIRNYTIIRVVQGTHHQDEVRYGTSRGIQCSCMSLISVSWALFKSPGLWDKFDLRCILGKGDLLFKFIGTFRYLGIEEFPQKVLIENSSINLEFLENNLEIRKEEIRAGAYLLSFAEIIKNAQQIKTSALLLTIVFQT